MVLVFIIINIILFGLEIILKVNCIGQLDIIWMKYIIIFLKFSKFQTVQYVLDIDQLWLLKKKCIIMLLLLGGGGGVTSGESMSECVGLPSIFSFSCTVSVFSSLDTE